MKTKKKAQIQPYFKGDPSVNLLEAVGDWVRSQGGDVVVAGGICTLVYPTDAEFTFYVSIKCTGRIPKAVPASS